MKTSEQTSVYIFKVKLKYAKRIWRRIALRGDQTLGDLHEAIFEAFDRDDEHLYAFYFYKPESRTKRDRWRNAVEYAHPYFLEDNMFDDRNLHNAADVKLETLHLEKGQTFDYLFDFGDSWWHEITVEKIDAELEKGRYPKIKEKRGESPPQYSYEDDADE